MSQQELRKTARNMPGQTAMPGLVAAAGQKPAPDAVDNIVAQWRREMPTLAAEHMALIGRIKRCAALIQPRLDAVFAEHGLSSAAFDVLATLRRSGPPYALTPTALFDSLMVTSGTMTVRLQKLQAQGLIRRLPNPDDARSMLVQLTERGRTLIEQALFPHVDNEARMLAALPADVQQRLNQDLSLLLRVLEAEAPTVRPQDDA